MCIINIKSDIEFQYHKCGEMKRIESNDIEIFTSDKEQFESVESNFGVLEVDFNVLYESRISKDKSVCKQSECNYYEINLKDVSKQDIDSIISLLHSWLGIHEEHFIREEESGLDNMKISTYEWK